MRLHVMELEERARLTSAFGSDERAASAIPPPHRSPHGRRHVARARRANAGGARARGFREALPLEPFNQKRDGAIEDLGGVP